MANYRQLVALSVLLAVLSACASSRDAASDVAGPRHAPLSAAESHTSSSTRSGPPPLKRQVERAQWVGPGELNYCPTRPGGAAFAWRLAVPGDPKVPGWCRTSVRRQASHDLVTFRLTWDASRFGHRGTMSLTYDVPWKGGVQSRLVRQAGLPPP